MFDDSIFIEIFGETQGLTKEQKEFLFMVNLHFSLQLNYIQKHQGFKINIEWINSHTNDTFSVITKGNSEFIIQINTYFVSTIHLIAHRIFSYINIVGVLNSPETSDRNLSEVEHNLISKGVEFKACIDAGRFFLAEQFAFWMVKFVFYHEIQHIVSNHFNLNALYNEKVNQGEKDATLTLQVLEVDADRSAMFTLLESIKDVVKSKELINFTKQDPYFEKVYKVFYDDKTSICLWVGVMIYICFKFREKSWNEETITKKKHPPNFTRAQLLIKELCILASSDLNEIESAEVDYKFTAKVIALGEMAYSFTGKPVDFNTQDMTTVELLEYGENISNRARDIFANRKYEKKPKDIFN